MRNSRGGIMVGVEWASSDEDEDDALQVVLDLLDEAIPQNLYRLYEEGTGTERIVLIETAKIGDEVMPCRAGTFSIGELLDMLLRDAVSLGYVRSAGDSVDRLEVDVERFTPEQVIGAAKALAFH